MIEREAAVGGCLGSARTETGFWLDLGAHTAYNSYGGFIEILEACGLMDRLVAREKAPFKLLEEGQRVSIPSALRYVELLTHLPRGLFAKRAETTVAEYYGGLVGPRNYERVLRPMLSAVPSQPVDDFPATALFRTRPRRKDVLRSFSIEGGLQTVAAAIAARDGIEVVTGTQVDRLDRDGDGFVVCAGERRWTASAAAVALPPPGAADVLATGFPDLAKAIQAIESTPVETVGVVVAADRIDLEPLAVLAARDEPFTAFVSRDVVPDPRFRGFAFHFRPGRSQVEKLAKISEVLGVARCDLLEIFEREVVLPSPARGHEVRVAAVEAQARAAGVALAGNYFEGMAIEDCVARSRALAEGLGA